MRLCTSRQNIPAPRAPAISREAGAHDEALVAPKYGNFSDGAAPGTASERARRAGDTAAHYAIGFAEELERLPGFSLVYVAKIVGWRVTTGGCCLVSACKRFQPCVATHTHHSPGHKKASGVLVVCHSVQSVSLFCSDGASADPTPHCSW